MSILGWIEDNVVDQVADAAEDVYNDTEDFVEDTVDFFEDAGSAIADGAETFVNGVVDTAEDIWDWAEDTGEAVVDWAEDRWEEIQSFASEAADFVVNTVQSVLDSVDTAMESLAEFVVDGWNSLVDAIEAAAEWAGQLLEDAVNWIVDEALPAIWAVAKTIAYVLAAIILLPFFLASILICTWVTRNYGSEYGSVIENILSGSPRYREMLRIVRLPAKAKYFISSDLHLYSTGNLDTAEMQGTKTLYRGVLEYYHKQGYNLVENGDIEDYWLRGGSGYGVAYDLASYLPSPAIDNAFLDNATSGISQSHLAKVILNNAGTYATIRTLFHDNGRYHRTIGNHDDAYCHPSLVEMLRRIYPGVDVADYIVLDDNGTGTGVICHGHQTDSWNQPACSFLGKFVTSFASAVRDLPFVEWNVGVPSSETTSKLWGSQALDEMGEVSPWFGINTDLGSLDEVQLFHAFHKIWGHPYPVLGSLDAGPYLILGHTHGPLAKAGDPNNWFHWERYFNSGSGIFHRMITGIEWDGTADPSRPSIRLVAWRYDETRPDQAIVRAVINRLHWQGDWAGAPLPSSEEDTRLSRGETMSFLPQLWRMPVPV